MAQSDTNLFRNDEFCDGTRSPKSWDWNPSRGKAEWRFHGEDEDRILEIETHGADAGAGFSQKLRCKGDQWYRVEVFAEIDGDTLGSAHVVLDIELQAADGSVIRKHRRVGPARTADPTVWREYIHTLHTARRMVLSIGIAGGPAELRLHRAACVSMDDPETLSHALAVPPPSRGHTLPRRVKRVAVVGSASDALTDMLHVAFGKNAIAMTPNDKSLATTNCDGVILCGATLPRPLRTWRALKQFAEQRVVVISPAQFARLAGGRSPHDAITVRKLEQDEEPIFAKVRDSNFLTAGLALLDVFPYGDYDTECDEFLLTCFRRTRGLARFIEREGFSTTLVSEAATDATTDLPLCLVRETERGAIVVLDLSPIQSTGVTEPVPQLAATLLLNALGRPQAQVGQFIVPEWDIPELASQLRQLAERFPPLCVGKRAIGEKAFAVPTLTCGTPTAAFGLPVKPRPTIVIRTGFRGRDWVGVYAVWHWLKQLTRPEPWQAPHLRALLEQCDIHWTPLAQPAAWTEGAPAAPLKIQPTDEACDLCIDIVTGDSAGGRILLPQRSTAYTKRVTEAWPLLMRDVFPADVVTRRTSEDDDPADASEMAWHSGWPEVSVERPSNGDAVDDRTLRIELPAVLDNGPIHSIWRVEQAAVLVESLVGLWAGPMAVNRTGDVRHWSAPAWLNGDTLVIAPDGKTSPVKSRDTGAARKLTLPSGHTLLIPPTQEPSTP